MQRPYCRCLYEIENKIERTKYCHVPCGAQRIILKQREMEQFIKYPLSEKDMEVDLVPGYLFPKDIYGWALEKAYLEVARAKSKYKDNFNSTHEGFAVLKEEVDEMWDDIKKDRLPESIAEAVQVAAMAIRYIAEMGIKKQ